MATQSDVTVIEEYILGPENTPFYTKQWSPVNKEPKAFILFVHGFAEHINRYNHFFPLLAAEPFNIHIMAFDQRGFGQTSQTPLTSSSPEVIKWKSQGKTVKLEKNAKRKTGGWAKVMPDIEWFVRYMSDKAKKKGKNLFLHGFSMGGGETLAFVTRPTAPPSKDTISLLSGVIAGGPLIRLTKAPPSLQLKAGTFAASLGLGGFLLPAPVDFDALSHDKASNDRCKNDPLCDQVGSIRGVADMLNGGMSLDTATVWNAWPTDLPLLIYHGSEDAVCDPKTAERFYQNVKATDKTFHSVEGMFHEVHNELGDVPAQVAKIIGDWVLAHSGETSTGTLTAPESTPAVALVMEYETGTAKL